MGVVHVGPCLHVSCFKKGAREIIVRLLQFNIFHSRAAALRAPYIGREFPPARRICKAIVPSKHRYAILHFREVKGAAIPAPVPLHLGSSSSSSSSSSSRSRAISQSSKDKDVNVEQSRRSTVMLIASNRRSSFLLPLSLCLCGAEYRTCSH